MGDPVVDAIPQDSGVVGVVEHNAGSGEEAAKGVAGHTRSGQCVIPALARVPIFDHVKGVIRAQRKGQQAAESIPALRWRFHRQRCRAEDVERRQKDQHRRQQDEEHA
ncbi:MAG: hypothetical protein BWY63_00947 [Chloroflexi bacterium ADurb.Bin360]|nr:MAG: hypothetical protein BWY63_00947 [Chloroflexi bacterium ADurb.Bin360]